MNYTQVERTSTNPSSHEQTIKLINIHKIEASIQGTLWWVDKEITTEHFMAYELQRCEKAMRDEMKRMLTREEPKSFSDKMAIIGFKAAV